MFTVLVSNFKFSCVLDCSSRSHHPMFQVINIANLKYFEAGKLALELSDLSSLDVDKTAPSRIFNDWMIKLHQGQVTSFEIRFL